MQRKKQRRGKEATRHSAAQLIGESLDLPNIAKPHTAHLEISGNSEALVDGCKGILAYDDGYIKLNLGRGTVAFTGSDLSLENMTFEQAVITGVIATVEFGS